MDILYIFKDIQPSRKHKVLPKHHRLLRCWSHVKVKQIFNHPKVFLLVFLQWIFLFLFFFCCLLAFRMLNFISSLLCFRDFWIFIHVVWLQKGTAAAAAISVKRNCSFMMELLKFSSANQKVIFLLSLVLCWQIFHLEGMLMTLLDINNFLLLHRYKTVLFLNNFFTVAVKIDSGLVYGYNMSRSSEGCTVKLYNSTWGYKRIVTDWVSRKNVKISPESH